MLAAITRQVAAEDSRWRVDPLRIYVAGLSAGGAMALIMATAYPDLFAAAGVHSAPAYRSAIHGGQALPAMAARTTVPPPAPGAAAMAPLLVIQGTADEVVAPLNGDRVADQWLAFRAARGHRGGRSGPGRPHPHRPRPHRRRPPLHPGSLVHRSPAAGAGVLADPAARARLVRRSARRLLQRPGRPAGRHPDVDVLPQPPAGPVGGRDRGPRRGVARGRPAERLVWIAGHPGVALVLLLGTRGARSTPRPGAPRAIPATG